MLKLAGFLLPGAWRFMMTQYLKPPLSFEAQLAQLQARGLQIGDIDIAKHYLQRVGYYRLMGYLYPQREVNSDNYRMGATFEAAIDAYEFDRTLRELVMEAIGHIEVAARTLVAYHFSHAYGAFGHLDANNVRIGVTQHAVWLEGVHQEVERSREAFIRHYRDKYTRPAFPSVPIWMATEIMSLGSLSRFYRGLRGADQKVVARDLGVAAPVLENWLHVITVARNVVAHHSRLWNKELGVSSIRPRSAGWSRAEAPFPEGRCFFLLLLLKHLLGATAADHINWRDRVDAHLKSWLNNDGRILGVGAAPGWDVHRIWRT